MAVIFKIVFALFALFAMANAFPSEAANGEAKQEVSQGVSTGIEDHLAAGSPHYEDIITAAEDAHPRQKRGCKGVSYQKGGRTITLQKC